MASTSYLIKSPKTGVYSYRRGVPKEYRAYFGGKREVKRALKTKDIHEAKLLASIVNKKFESQLADARGGYAPAAKAYAAQRRTEKFMRYVKEEQVRPQDAPTGFGLTIGNKESLGKFVAQQKKYERRRDAILDQLREVHEDVGLDYTGELDETGWPQMRPNEQWYEIQSKIDYLEGKRSDISSFSDDTVTLGSCIRDYTNHKRKELRDKPRSFKNLALTLNNLSQRFTAVLVDHPSYDRSEYSDPLEFPLHKLEVSVAFDFKEQLETMFVPPLSPSWRAKHLSQLSTLWNHGCEMAAKRGFNTERLTPYANPFRPALQEAKRETRQAVEAGEFVENRCRAWTPAELKRFQDNIETLKQPDIRLIAKILMYYGSRIADICMMNVDEFLRGDDPTSPDQHAYFHFGYNRRLTKGSQKRKLPIPAWLLKELDEYVVTLPARSTKLFPRFSIDNGPNNASKALRKKLKPVNNDPLLKIHGLRSTLSSKFLALGMDDKMSGYVIGWKQGQQNKNQELYQRDPYELHVLAEKLEAAHHLDSWGSIADELQPASTVGELYGRSA